MIDTIPAEHKAIIDNIEYIVVQDEKYITVKRYNKKHKMWIEFVYDKDNIYNDETELLTMLQNEYIQQQKKKSI